MVATPVGAFVAQRSVEWQPGMAAQLFFRPESVEFLDQAAVARTTHRTMAPLSWSVSRFSAIQRM